MQAASDAEMTDSFCGALPLPHQPKRSVGVPGRCRRDQLNELELETKYGLQFKTAAFVVSCDAGSKAIFSDESIWPEGFELAIGSSTAKRRLAIALIRRRTITTEAKLARTMTLNINAHSYLLTC